MSRILVTGAAGFIGSHTTDLLLAQGHEVVGLDNFRTGHRRNLAAALGCPGFRLVEGDFTDAPSTSTLFGTFRPDAVIHLAALVSVPESIKNPAENDRLNLTGTRTLASLCATAGVARIVFASSAAVYGACQRLPLDENCPTAPLSPYGEAKLASEAILLALAQASPAVVRCHRYFNVFGPRQDPSSAYSGVISRFADALAKDAVPTIFGDGLQTRDFVYVGDVARANVLAATAPGLTSGCANICSGHAVSLLDLWRTLSALRGVRMDPQFGPPRPGDIRHSLGNPAAARHALAGFAAEISLEEGLRRLLGTLA